LRYCLLPMYAPLKLLRIKNTLIPAGARHWNMSSNGLEPLRRHRVREPGEDGE
jgi:hypothetical protein